MMMMNETTMARKMSERHRKSQSKLSFQGKGRDPYILYMTSWSGILSIYRKPRGSIARLEACRGRSDVMTDLSRRCCVWNLWMAGVEYVVVPSVHKV